MFTYGANQRPTIQPASGNTEPQPSRLLNSKATRFVLATIRATVTISVAAATAIRNGGWAAALFSDMGLLEGGKPVAAGDPRLFAFASEAMRGAPGTHTHLTSTAVGATTLRQQIMIPFEWVLHAVNPRETQFLELDPGQALELYFTQALNNGRDRILTVGGATVAITAVSVQVEQFYDDYEQDLPLLRPAWRQFSHNIAGANPQLEIPIAFSDYIRAITICQDTDEGRRGDLINKIGLRGDRGWIIEQMSFDDFARSREFFHGGNVYAEASGALVHINFQEAGRLRNVLSPYQDNNIRWVMDVSVPGGTNPKLLFLLHLLERNPKGKAARRVTVTDDQFPAIGI